MKAKTILVLVIVLLVITALTKHFYFNLPNETPREIVQNIVDYAQEDNPTAEDKEKIVSYYKEGVNEDFSKETSAEDSSSGSDVVVDITNVEESSDKATVTIEMSVVLVKVPVQFKLIKEGNFWTGYKWLIGDVVSSLGGEGTSSQKEESSASVGEKISIGSDFHLIVSSPSDYIPSSTWEQADEGMKFVALELEYINETSASDTISPSNLTLRDSEGHSYEASWFTGKEPKLEEGTTVTAGGSAKGYATYQVPENANITSAVYSNSYSTVTIDL